MTADDAAINLLRQLAFPPHMANVWIWHDKGQIELVVRLDPNLMCRRQEVPASFGGFPVTVKPREDFLAAN